MPFDCFIRSKDIVKIKCFSSLPYRQFNEMLAGVGAPNYKSELHKKRVLYRYHHLVQDMKKILLIVQIVKSVPATWIQTSCDIDNPTFMNFSKTSQWKSNHNFITELKKAFSFNVIVCNSQILLPQRKNNQLAAITRPLKLLNMWSGILSRNKGHFVPAQRAFVSAYFRGQLDADGCIWTPKPRAHTSFYLSLYLICSQISF